MKGSLSTIWKKSSAAILLSSCINFAAIGDEQEEKTANTCRIDDTTTISRSSVKNIPGYFFRPFSEKRLVSYASGMQNFIFDLDTGKEIKIPGPYDPVPTADESVMTVPPSEGMTFYSIKDLMSGKQTPLLKDTTLKGVYQSIGTVKEEGDESIIRVITDQDELSYRDYKITKKNGSPSVTALGAGPKRLCKGIRIALPMISKDGKQIAALDVDAGTTKVYNFDTKTGKCKEVLNLNIPTGKVDFSFNNDELTFHVLNNSDKNEKYFEVPSDSMVANVYVYKRSTGKIRRITNNTQANSVFPAWRKDGNIVYLHHPQRQGRPQKDSSFVVADPKKTNSLDLDSIAKPVSQCKDPQEETRTHAVAALGALWASLCSKYGDQIGTGSAALITLGLDPKRCQQMVIDLWDKKKKTVLQNKRLVSSANVKEKVFQDLEVNDLLKACPTTAYDPTGMGGPGDKGGDQKKTPPVPLVCFQCHSDDIPFDNWEALKTAKAASGRTFIEEIRFRLGPGAGRDKMPPGNRSIPNDSRKAFENYLATGEF